MNRFAGMMCPYCKSEILEDDDVVVCSECDMPHHKDCWVENQGCTTFGCCGTIQNSNSSQAIPNNLKTSNFEIEMFPSGGGLDAAYCSKCGSRHDSNDMFCRHCGHCFNINPNAPQNGGIPNTYAEQNTANAAAFTPRSQNFLDRDLIGPNADYYLHKFSDMSYRRKSTSWNGAAFLFAPYWCMYRKMYGIGASVVAGAFVISSFGIIGNILVLVGYILFGLYANYLYMQRITRLMAEACTLTDKPARTQFVHKKGGGNTVATVLLAVGYLILLIILDLN